VLLNIIKNGMDALESRPGKITIVTTGGGSALTIAISDTGKGMDREQLENIFVPFFTTKEVGKGTGLGLSVSYGIVRSLGGTIDVESTPGEGSTFTLILPMH
jgi:two-component system NtrC family sensor kinase